MKKLRFVAFFISVLTSLLLTPAVSQNSSGFEAFGIRKVAFETGPGSFFKPREDIFVLDSLTSKPRRLATGIGAVWSPDGQKIAYCAHEGWGTKHIVLGQMQIINADGSGHTELTNIPGGACPVEWLPDGRITFSGGTLVLDSDAGRVASVLKGPGGLRSPDGTKRAFFKYRESRQSSGSIWVVDADGTNSRKVIDDNSEWAQLCWSPDGESILFSSHRDNKERSEIFRVRLDGSHLETIAADRKLSFTHPLISPDGKYLVVVASSGSGDPSIMLLQVANQTRTFLAHGHTPNVLWEKR
jgi:Tol biopolymer transport system component